MIRAVLFSATFAFCVAYGQGYDIGEDFKSRMKWLAKNFKQGPKLAQDDPDDSKRMKWRAKNSKQGRKLAKDDSDDSERDERNVSSSESDASCRNRAEKHKGEVQSLRMKLETTQTELATTQKELETTQTKLTATQTEVGELRGQVNMLFSSLQNNGFNFPPTNSHGPVAAR